MQVGLVGKPSCGKSSFFKALTMADVAIAPYPFTTITPNKGFGFVRTECADNFFKVQCNPRYGYCINHTRYVPVEVLDVAGLVEGAHQGKGLGNKFLDDLRQADALIHIIDASGSTNEKGEPVAEGSHDPLKDIAFLVREIDLWYLAILKKGWERLAREAQIEHKKVNIALAKQVSGLNVKEEHVNQAIQELKLNPEKPAEWKEEELLQLACYLRKKTKPMIIAANKIDLKSSKDNITRMKKAHPEETIIPCSAEAELTLKLAAKNGLIEYAPGAKEVTIKGKPNQKQQEALDKIKALIAEYGSTGIQEAIETAVFKLLKYTTIFPGGVNKLSDSHGNILPDCFLMPPGTTALDFAYKLHTDFGKNFIRAIDVKSKRPVGKEHLLQTGDVVEIVSGK